ncbi:diaminopimelate epimerase [Alterisphingorhabdus coralli]|uniref:Diaminopimelate epimerase n=1 Tax=Alterisphingorhabdus coralli TaxID=3071408 RepID=A0AA97F8W0_9SPHN|nr:diaminopimelate epimerase [Parasphingorhabdus sp. SCSIO 66989]WOE76539.1 diaminopimelate epimerase [Parasphingorhabdus sp. SCSIO 66989]
MTATAFTKMHGLGNDFAIFDARVAPVHLHEAQVRALADRQRGIGFDQLILLGQSDKADVHMRIFNANGGEVEACGNATRCVIALLGKDAVIETRAGLLKGELLDDTVRIDMGEPRFDWDAIPLAQPMDTMDMPVGWEMLERPMAVNIGNPHVIAFVDDPYAVDMARLGPQIETDPLFPEGVNVNVASVSDNAITLRVWERGAGLTEACGTGACATAVAAIRRKLVSGPVAVHLPGGKLTIDWQPGGTISMTGPFASAFTGEVEL